MFDRQAYDQWDSPGKEALSGHLTAQGYDVRVSGLYDIDFSVSGYGRAFNVDVEVRPLRIWSEGFPFPEVQLPGRKVKHSGDYNWLVVLNPYLTHGVAFRADIAACSPRLQKDCGRGSDEWVMSVPLESGREFILMS